MSEERIVDTHKLPSEQEFFPALRPERLVEFIGQAKARENLQVFIEATLKRKEALDHVLLYGPPGLGKTTLAQIIAKELGVNLRVTSGPIITKAGDLAALLTSLEARDVLFIDEIHRLNATIEEVLYPAMEDFKLDLMIGEGPSARSIQIDLPPFTLIGATTRSGLITRPLRERFGIPLGLTFYNPPELMQIILCNAKKLQMPLTEAGAMELAKRCRGTPRIAGRLLRRIRDIAFVESFKNIDAREADYALHKLDVDQKGFDAIDRTYLICIAHNYGGGPVGVDTVAAALSEQRDVIEEVIEPYLLQQGYVQRTPRGRILTKAAYAHLGLPFSVEDSSETQFNFATEEELL